jgi:anti-sigma B factor antagonist
MSCEARESRLEGALNISIRKAGPATILDLEGALRLGHDKDLLELFHNKVQEIVESGSLHIAVNLAGVTDLDSAGIGELVRAFTSLRKARGRCVFFAPTKQVQMLLKIVGLDTIFNIVEDEASALTIV